MGGWGILCIEVHFFAQISISFLYSTLPLFNTPKALCSLTNKRSHIRCVPFSLRLHLASSLTSMTCLKCDAGWILSEPEEIGCDTMVGSPAPLSAALAAPLSQSPGKGQEWFIKNPPPCSDAQAWMNVTVFITEKERPKRKRDKVHCLAVDL